MSNLFDRAERRSITDAALAEAVGVSKVSVHRYRTGDAMPRLDVYVRLWAAASGIRGIDWGPWVEHMTAVNSGRPNLSSCLRSLGEARWNQESLRAAQQCYRLSSLGGDALPAAGRELLISHLDQLKDMWPSC